MLHNWMLLHRFSVLQIFCSRCQQEFMILRAEITDNESNLFVALHFDDRW